jgi:uncharacterized surface protein with fasciclin (FAS1) repeats
MHRTMLILAGAAALAGCQEAGDENGTAAPPGAPSTNEVTAVVDQGTVAEALGKSADLSTFLDAAKAAGLDTTLGGSQPYTLFAPTNAAFEKLPAGTLDTLKQPEQKGELTSLITSHIVPGAVTAEDLARAIEQGDGKAEIATMAGTTLTASKDGDAIVISDGEGAQARIIGAGTPVANGAVHSIDSVLVAQE